MELLQLTRSIIKGTADLHALKRSGRLRAEHLWVAEAGAEKYIRAVAVGDLAHPTIKAMRLDICTTECDGVTARPSGGGGFGYCGPALEEHLDGPEDSRTCGCLIEGKASVRSERCPRGKW